MGPSLRPLRLSLLPAYPSQNSSLLPSFVHPVVPGCLRSVSEARTRLCTAMRATSPPYPRGPRSGPGYAVPIHHHLIGPIRPTRRHIATSPHSGLYAMPSLCGSAEATREWFRAFAVHSFPTCRSLRPRGAWRCVYPVPSRRALPSPRDQRLGTPDVNPFGAY